MIGLGLHTYGAVQWLTSAYIPYVNIQQLLPTLADRLVISFRILQLKKEYYTVSLLDTFTPSLVSLLATLKMLLLAQLEFIYLIKYLGMKVDGGKRRSMNHTNSIKRQ